MSLNHTYQRAVNTVDALPADGRDRIVHLCGEIRQAQQHLLRSAAPLMTRCIRQCQGLCCRNILEESLIHFWDFFYILVAEGTPRETIARHLTREDSLFPSDCIFLENGVGPCIFPPDVRPERCLTAFCFDADPVRKEIARVKLSFHRLAWSTQSIRLKACLRSLASRFKPTA